MKMGMYDYITESGAKAMLKKWNDKRAIEIKLTEYEMKP